MSVFQRFIHWIGLMFNAALCRRRRRQSGGGGLLQWLEVVPSSVSGGAGDTQQLQVLLQPVGTDITSRIVPSTSNKTIATIDAPTLSSISPSTINRNDSAIATVFTGTNIKGTETIGGLPTGVTVASYTYTSTTVTCNLTASGSATTGAANLSLVSPRGDSGTQTLTVANATPTLTSISPNTIVQSTGPITYTFTGTKFRSGQTIGGLPSGVTAGTVTVASSTSITVPLTASGSATLGAASLDIVDATYGTSGNQTLTVNATGGITPAFVQSDHSAHGFNSTSLAQAMTSSVTAGNSIVVGVMWTDISATCSIADTLGNTYTAIGSPVFQSGRVNVVQLFYTKSASGGANTVTITCSTSTTLQTYVQEFSGVLSAGLDDHNGNGSNAANPSTPALTTTAANDLVVAMVSSESGGNPTVGAGFTLSDSYAANAYSAIEYQIVSSAGSVTPAFVAGFGNFWACVSVAFKAG